MSRVRYYFALFTLIAFLVIGSSVSVYVAVLKTKVPLSSVVVEWLLVGLLSFLLLLVARYFLLLWFSYLQQIEDTENEPSGYEPFASILVPAYNEGKVLDASIMSLLRLQYPHFEVIVIDDGSTDDTYARARSWEGTYGCCTVTAYTKSNSGKAETLNFGIEKARGEVIACIDSDSRLDPDSIRLAARHFLDPRVGAVAGNVKVSNRKTLFGRLQALEYIEGLNLVRKAQAFFRTVNIVPGPLGLFRREVLLQVGCYDSDTFAEDCDLTLKILRGGWHITYEPGAIAFTEAPEQMRDLLKQRYRWTRGILQSLKKHRSIFWTFKQDVALPIMTAHMAFEGILWPAMNIMANVFLIYVGAVYGFSSILILWWLQLTLLDLAMALHCNVMEREDLGLVGHAVCYRIFYVLVIDIYKVFALIEETLGLRMVWGKLDRLGKV